MTRIIIPIILLALSVSACDSGPNEPDYSGTYSLTLVNGQALPQVVDIGQGERSLISGALVLSDGGGFSMSFVREEVDGSRNTTSLVGEYSVSSTTIQFDYTNPITATELGTITGSVIVLASPPLTLTFRK